MPKSSKPRKPYRPKKPTFKGWGSALPAAMLHGLGGRADAVPVTFGNPSNTRGGIPLNLPFPTTETIVYVPTTTE